MKANPKKPPPKKTKSIPLLEKKCLRLEQEINKLQNKILKLENKTLKQEQIILNLRAEIRKRDERPMILVGSSHDKPPEN